MLRSAAHSDKLGPHGPVKLTHVYNGTATSPTRGASGPGRALGPSPRRELEWAAERAAAQSRTGAVGGAGTSIGLVGTVAAPELPVRLGAIVHGKSYD